MARKQQKSGSKKTRNKRGRAAREVPTTGRSGERSSAVLGGVFGLIRKLIITALLVLLGIVIYKELTAESTTELDLRGKLGCSGPP